MNSNVAFLNIGLAFLEGVALIISPCILPILPIILSVSLEGGKRRPLGVILGFVVTFAFFTLFARQLVLLVGLNLDLVRYISYALLILLGIIMMSSYLTEKFGDWTQRLADLGARVTVKAPQNGFGSGVILGSLVGLIWTPCAGPILAAVIVQTVLQQSNVMSFFTLLAFAIGTAVPMLIIIFFGRTLLKQVKFLQEHAVLIRKMLGVIIILAVLGMIVGNKFYAGEVKASDMITTSGTQLQDGLPHPFPAPDFASITAWINSPPLHIQDLRGKVVLIDFWAYSCINCIRTFPYLHDWYDKYHSAGFEIVGVHSPEFDFERDLKNVQAAVHADGIKYPVALDNQFATWQNYHCQAWPGHYLIDKQGNVVYEHFGEGDYAITENNIRYLLGINQSIAAKEVNETYANITPETYLGYARSQAFASPESIRHDVKAQYSYPQSLAPNEWALDGAWIIAGEKIISAEDNSRIKIHFLGKKVFAVMGAGAKIIKASIKFNGVSVMDQHGQDVQNGEVEIMEHKLYRLINLTKESGGELELQTSEPGLEIYTFTFGN